MKPNIAIAIAIAKAACAGKVGPDWRLYPSLMVEAAVQMLGREKYTIGHIAKFLDAPTALIKRIHDEYFWELKRVNRKYTHDLQVLEAAVSAEHSDKHDDEAVARLIGKLLRE